MKLSNRELATVLAALRHWQGHVEHAKELSCSGMPQFDDATPLDHEEINDLCDKLNEVGDLSKGEDIDFNDEVVCSICGRYCAAGSVHVHQDRFIGDECCWDERLRASE